MAGKAKSPDRFDPENVKSKASKSSTRRIALFIFMAAGALFTLVTFAIINSDDGVRSGSAPADIIQAARPSAMIIPPGPREVRPEEAPSIAIDKLQPQSEEDENTRSQNADQNQLQAELQPQVQQPQVVRSVRPAYLPAPRGDRARSVTDRRREAQSTRLQAAASPTSIQGFGRNANADGSAANLAGAAGGIPEAAAITGANATGTTQNVNDTLNALVGSDNAQANQDAANGWSRKESFRNQALPAEYSQHTRAFPVSALELKAGSLLPCVLISGLNSDLPGNLIAQVSENVWDTATGRYLLIPRGSRLIGTYDHQITYGQNRALVIWSRLIFPDGSSLLLDNLQGTDQAGYSGFKGRVDRHWGNMITSALMVSLLGAGVELASNNSRNNNNNNSNRQNVGDILAERAATAIAEAMTQIINKSMNRQPTITVKPGYRFMIFIQHDVVFPKVWSNGR